MTEATKGKRNAGSRLSTRNRPADDDMLEACITEMARVGGDRTTMDAVAEHVPTTKATLYAHFGSREQLLLAATERELASATRWLYDAYDRNWNLKPELAIRAAVAALFDYARARPHGFRVLLNTDHSAKGHHSGSNELTRALERRVAQWIRTLQEGRGADVGRGDSADVLAAICVSISTSLARTALNNDFDLDVVTALATDATLHALRGLAPVDLAKLDAR